MKPSSEELRAYCQGSLSPERFAAIDGWLAALPEAEAEVALREAGVDAQAGAALDALPGISGTGYISDLPRGRLHSGARLGEGGMAVVTSAEDRVLRRAVAVKVLRPRRADESLEDFHLRTAAFRREAALTAGLEHPAIPPVYDVGSDDGLPAFAMRQISGHPLDAVIAEGRLALADRVELLLRVAEAIAYAHSRGVVHRDLTPRNILVGEFGAVYVLDWGLAAAVGSSDGVRAGTPGWMAPEQATVAPADPRMDVFGLGGLARFVLAGQPRSPGLEALMARCLASDPAQRYRDGAVVVEDLRRWLAEGITMAQEIPNWALVARRWWHSPRARTGLAVAVMVALAMLIGWQAQRTRMQAEARERIAALAGSTSLTQAEAVDLALAEVRSIHFRQPHLAQAEALEARLLAAQDLIAQRSKQEVIRRDLAVLLQRTRTLGPWADQVQAWRSAIRAAGLNLDPVVLAADVQRIADHQLRDELLTALAFLWRAEKERGADFHASHTAALLAGAGPTLGWQSLGRLLGRTQFAAHDPVFCDCPDAAGVLTEVAPTAIALALFAPEPRLTAAARTVLSAHPGDFWALLASARASLSAGDAAGAERVALIASGAEPNSVLPVLIRAYAALDRSDLGGLTEATERGQVLAQDHAEITVLLAVARARQGRLAEAQALVNQLPASHLQYHLHHQVGHPMERSVQALVSAGLHIAEAPAELGKLSP